MHKSFDLVVCNPLLMESTTTKNEKLDTIEKHSDNAYFMTDDFQVQELITAHELLNMKDNGKTRNRKNIGTDRWTKNKTNHT